MTTAQKIIKYCAIAFALFLIVSIFTGIFGAISGISALFGKKDVVGKMKNYAISDTVESLEIELSGAQLEIKTGNAFSLESNHKFLNLQNKDGLLQLKEDDHTFGLHSGDVQVNLTVPENFVFDKVNISTGAGIVKIDNLLADDLALDLGAGEVNIDKLVAYDKAKINGGAGELNIRGGELADLDFDMGIGEVNMISALTGNSEIDYGVGEMNLTLIGSADDYCVVFDKGIGHASIDGVKVHDGMVYGGGENAIEIDGGVGAAKIEFYN